MTLAVEFYPEAATHLLAASDWSESHPPGTGEKLLLAADKAMERVAMWPESGSPEAAGSVGASIRSVRLTGTRYRAVYMVIELAAHDQEGWVRVGVDGSRTGERVVAEIFRCESGGSAEH